MKMRTIKLTPKFLMERLQGKPSAFTVNLPPDTELLEIKYDLFSGQVLAIVRSNSFEDIPEKYPIPEFNVTYSTASKTGPVPQSSIIPASTFKPEAKPTEPLVPEPVSAKTASISPESDTRLMEEEFTDEQRKLLSFSAGEEFVVVKPIKFLKAEWDDINDTVRSLGGRWVKGDIISYWEIPRP